MSYTGNIARALGAAFVAATVGSAARSDEITVPTRPSNWIMHGGVSLPQAGHAEFCKNFPASCAYRATYPTYQRYNGASRLLLARIQDRVNTETIQLTDMEIHGREEVWTYPVNGKGDCEDVVLEKRRLLIAEGWEPSSLMIAVVAQKNGDGHAVLIARTDEGDYMLDNLTKDVVRWDKSDYRFIRTTDPLDYSAWLAVVPREQVPVINVAARPQ